MLLFMLRRQDCCRLLLSYPVQAGVLIMYVRCIMVV